MRANIADMAKRGRPPSKDKSPPEPTRIGRLSQLHPYVDEWLEELSVSDAQLAGRLDVAPSTITKWRDKGWKITLPNIGAIAHALDLEPQERIFTPPGSDLAAAIEERVRLEFQKRLQRALGGD